MEASEPLIDTPTISKVMSALDDIRKTYSTPYARRAKLPRTLSDAQVKKLLEQVQTAEKQCGDVAAVAQHFGVQLHGRIAESKNLLAQVEQCQRRIADLELQQIPIEPDLTNSSIISFQTQQDPELLQSLRSENDSLKSEMRRLRREIARCDTPKDQLKKQFFEYGLPLELQADFKALEAKAKLQEETIAGITSQVAALNTINSALQTQMQSLFSQHEAAAGRCKELEEKLAAETETLTTSEREMNGLRMELMQEKFLNERLNRVLRGIPTAEVFVQTEKETEEKEISAIVDWETTETQSEFEEKQTVEVACQSEISAKDCGEQTEVERKDEFAQTAVEILDADMQAGWEIEEKSTEMEEILTDEYAVQTEIHMELSRFSIVEVPGREDNCRLLAIEPTLRLEIAPEAIETVLESQGSIQISPVPIAKLQSFSTFHWADFAPSVKTLCFTSECTQEISPAAEKLAPIYAISTFSCGDLPSNRREVRLNFETEAIACCLAANCIVETCEICSQTDDLPMKFEKFMQIRTETVADVFGNRTEMPELAMSNTESIAIPPYSTEKQMELSANVCNFDFFPEPPMQIESVSELTQCVFSLQIDQQASIYVPAIVSPYFLSLVATEAVEIAPFSTVVRPNSPISEEVQTEFVQESAPKRAECGMETLEILFINPQIAVPGWNSDIYTCEPISIIGETEERRTIEICPTVLETEVRGNPREVPLLSLSSFSSLAVFPTIPTYNLSVSYLHHCSISSASHMGDYFPDLTVETCVLLSIYGEVIEPNCEFVSITHCEIDSIQAEEAELTLAGSTICDISGKVKQMSEISRENALSIAPSVVRRKAILSISKCPPSPANLNAVVRRRPALSLAACDSTSLDGFNFRQLFIEAAEEEAKGDDTGGKRRSRRRVVRKDPGEEFFVMCLQAMKLNFQDVPMIQKADQTALYAQAVSSGIPFYKWQDWLTSILLRR